MKQIGARQAQATVSAAPVVSSARGVAQAGTISGDLIAQLRMLEEMKSAISGLQAQIAVAFDLAQRAEQAEAGVPAAERGKGVGAQVALARRESPNRGSRLLGLAKALVTEMPRTLAALNKGLLNEWRATLLVKETACLSVEDRAAVDAELAPTPEPSTVPETKPSSPPRKLPRTAVTHGPWPNAPATPPPNEPSASDRRRTP
ncbi:hypothetical protein J2790_003054 [Paenarthrobacter nicotinovorans]|nr:hypothetical protein [Paenarthrobacter nicotinovorans]SCZ62680.1 hypothetical protein SAMN02799638_03489 [Arthrobacter sp. UNCCL28]